MASRLSDPILTWEQVRYQNSMFWRTPVAAFFTLFFPLFFLVLFAVMFGNDRIDIAGRGSFTVAQFYAPSLAVFGAVSATYTNLAIGTAIARDEGILKRFRGTPLRAWSYLGGRIGSGVWIASIAVVAMLVVGAVAYDLHVRVETIPAAIVTFIIGVSCFAALGLAVAGLAPTGDSAPAVANATILPLAFISDVFLPLDDPPRWLEVIGNVFPLKHFVRAFQDVFSPVTTDLGWRWGHLAVMIVWGLIGLGLALKFFAWEPRASSGGRRRRRG
ncbi:ABC transporter permease [bacterium]|nr:ABC transporter permease [bacterium]